MSPLRIFVGYDSKEASAYHVLAHSILRRASIPVTIAPLRREALEAAGLYTRPRGPTESTEFSLTRFLVPFLSGYEGISIFMDCDMLCLVDIAEILEHVEGGYVSDMHEVANHPGEERTLPDGTKMVVSPCEDCETALVRDRAVWVCKHDYVPKSDKKFLGQVQTKYPRKNWSSFMVFDNSKCRALTPRMVNHLTGLELHRFLWLDDKEVGGLPLTWNWLVGEYPKIEPASLLSPRVLHYTLGGPWFEATRDCDYADLWREELRHMLGSAAAIIT